MFRQLYSEMKLLAKIVRGLFRPSLAKIVRDTTNLHLRNNSTIKAQRRTLDRVVIDWVAKRPLATISIGIILYNAVLYCTWLQPVQGPTIPEGLKEYYRDFSSLNIALLGTQAALIGLVFPLVIAFVGLLNQSHPSFASSFSIYLERTNVKFVAISSLLLCGAIVFIVPISAQLPVRVIAASTIVNILWFSINLVILSRFLLLSIRALHSAHWQDLVKEYTAQVLWKTELSKLVRENRSNGISHYNYLPKGDSFDFGSSLSKAYVSYSFFRDKGEAKVVRNFSGNRKRRLVDVKIGVLTPVVYNWIERARQKGAIQDLFVSVTLDQQYENEVVLARSTMPFTLIEELGFRLGTIFKYIPRNEEEISDTTLILRNMIANQRVLLDRKNESEFATDSSKLADFHAFLIKIAEKPDEKFNYTQMEKNLWSPLGEQWAREYRDLLRQSVHLLSEEPLFFSNMSHLAPRILGRCTANVSLTGTTHLLSINTLLSHFLLEWSSEQNGLDVTPSSTPSKAFELQGRNIVQRRAWTEWAGGWEQFAMYAGPLFYPMLEELPIPADVIHFFSEHLYETSKLVGKATWRGDVLAINWTTDMFLYWISNFEQYVNGRSRQDEYSLAKEKIVLKHLEQDLNQISDFNIALVDGALNGPITDTIFVLAFRNAWQDYSISLIVSLVHWALIHEHKEASLQASRILLQHIRHNGDDNHRGRRTGPSPTLVLVSFLRTLEGAEGVPNHSGLVSRLKQDLDNLAESPMVSGRIYSGSRSLSSLSQSLEKAIVLMACDGQTRIDDALKRMLTSGDHNLRSSKERFLSDLLSAMNDTNLEEHGSIWESIREGRPTATFDQRKVAIAKLLSTALGIIQNIKDEAIRNAQISEERLNELSLAASTSAFKNTQFPLNLFQSITSSLDQYKTYTLRNLNYETGSMTAPLLSDPVSNEEDWVSNTMQHDVASIVWGDIRHSLPFTSVEGHTPELFWQAIKECVRSIAQQGATPILIVNSISDPEWLMHWRWGVDEPFPRPADMEVTERPNAPSAYEFDINDIAVYRASTKQGCVYLIAQEALESVAFHEFENGHNVNASFEQNNDDLWHGTLSFEFQREVSVTNIQAFEIRFRTASNNPS